MSTKCSQLFLPQLGNRSSLNPSCFKEKQRPEWDFPGAKVAGIPKSPIRVSAKNPKATAVPCRTTRILKERGVFPFKSGSVFCRRRPRRRTGVREVAGENRRFSSRALLPPSGDTFRPLLGCLMGCVCLHKNIVEKGKCAGVGASPAPLCKGSWQKSLIFD